jgi:hypothetical protein
VVINHNRGRYLLPSLAASTAVLGLLVCGPNPPGGTRLSRGGCLVTPVDTTSHMFTRLCDVFLSMTHADPACPLTAVTLLWTTEGPSRRSHSPFMQRVPEDMTASGITVTQSEREPDYFDEEETRRLSSST